MTRTAAREIAVHLAFELGFGARSARELLDETLTPEHFASMAPDEPLYAKYPDEIQTAYIRALVEGIALHRQELDEYIVKYAVGWSFGRIPRVAVAVMQVAMFEVLYMPDVPDAAAINEAVELVRRYETDEVTAFVNGILGSFSRGLPQKDDGSAAPAEEASVQA